MIKKYNYINILAWTVIVACPFLLQQADLIVTNDWKISPDNGLISILTGTFLHSSFSHMTNNLVGILLGVSLLYNMYHNMYLKVIALGIVLPSTVMYLLGLNSVGISGLVYTLVWFVIIRGLMSKHYVKYFSSALLLIFYGSSLRSVVPSNEPFSLIAWQAHLVGVVVGLFLAIYSKLVKS